MQQGQLLLLFMRPRSADASRSAAGRLESRLVRLTTLDSSTHDAPDARMPGCQLERGHHWPVRRFAFVFSQPVWCRAGFEFANRFCQLQAIDREEPRSSVKFGNRIPLFEAALIANERPA